MVTETKFRVLTAAVAAFLDSGFEVPLSRIWTDAGLSNGSFFYLFKTRRALIEAVVSMILAERQAVRMAAFTIPGATGEAAVTGAVTACLRWCETETAHARVLLILPTTVPGPGHGTVDGPDGLREEIDKKRQGILTEQSNLQRRYRFQFEHLTRAKEDLEIELREFRREQQMFRSDRLRFLEQHRLRFRQMEHIRQLLLEREGSIDRESRIAERSKIAALSEIQRQQRRSEEEREAILRETESRQRRTKQQEATLADLVARLEERSQRLNRLRAELDQTQSEILEQRLVTEEARTSLLRDAASSDLARARLEQARGDVQSFFERLHSQVAAERDKIELTAVDLAARQQHFRNDRSELEQWFSKREGELSARVAGSVVDDQHQMIDTMQNELATLQSRWKNDRCEAEKTIRDLLDKLTVREMQSSETALHQISQHAPPSRDAA